MQLLGHYMPRSAAYAVLESIQAYLLLMISQDAMADHFDY